MVKIGTDGLVRRVSLTYDKYGNNAPDGFSLFVSELWKSKPPDWVKCGDSLLSITGWDKIPDGMDELRDWTRIVMTNLLPDDQLSRNFVDQVTILCGPTSDLNIIHVAINLAIALYIDKYIGMGRLQACNHYWAVPYLIDKSSSNVVLRVMASVLHSQLDIKLG
jgi:hypothetical protein